jgi:hypothetical protein
MFPPKFIYSRSQPRRRERIASAVDLLKKYLTYFQRPAKGGIRRDRIDAPPGKP